jgi:tRNA A64-2'-O-ribosylphosphate transferase
MTHASSPSAPPEEPSAPPENDLDDAAADLDLSLLPPELLPPPTHPSLSQLLTSLRRTNLTIHNRLTSILYDADFVRRASTSKFPGGGGRRPLVANERCGSWYVPPALKVAGAYFKSTDGHERAWKFSTRRLNLHLVEMAERCDG